MIVKAEATHARQEGLRCVVQWEQAERDGEAISEGFTTAAARNFATDPPPTRRSTNKAITLPTTTHEDFGFCAGRNGG